MDCLWSVSLNKYYFTAVLKALFSSNNLADYSNLSVQPRTWDNKLDNSIYFLAKMLFHVGVLKINTCNVFHTVKCD